MKTPPALLYHKITPRWDVSVALTSPRVFRAQMERLHHAGWCGVPLKDVSGEEGEFILAFDDGYECVLEYALDVLSEIGFRATIFIPTSYIGKWNDWDHQTYGLKFKHLKAGHLIRLVEAGWEVGSHTVSHRSLLEFGRDRIEKELVDSKNSLEDLIGLRIRSVSFPFGCYDQFVLDTAIEAGYQFGLTPRLNEHVRCPNDFQLIPAEAVYIWDRFVNLVGRVERTGKVYRVGRRFRDAVNRTALGTIIYQRFLPSSNKNLPEG